MTCQFPRPDPGGRAVPSSGSPGLVLLWPVSALQRPYRGNQALIRGSESYTFLDKFAVVASLVCHALVEGCYNDPGMTADLRPRLDLVQRGRDGLLIEEVQVLLKLVLYPRG